MWCVDTYVYCVTLKFSNTLEHVPEVGSLAHMVILFFNIWEDSILFSIMVVLTYILTNSVQVFRFLHTLPALAIVTAF
jgi:hypothetical protein